MLRTLAQMQSLMSDIQVSARNDELFRACSTTWRMYNYQLRSEPDWSPMGQPVCWP